MAHAINCWHPPRLARLMQMPESTPQTASSAQNSSCRILGAPAAALLDLEQTLLCRSVCLTFAICPITSRTLSALLCAEPAPDALNLHQTALLTALCCSVLQPALQDASSFRVVSTCTNHWLSVIRLIWLAGSCLVAEALDIKLLCVCALCCQVSSCSL